MVNQTLVLLKPDGIAKSLTGNIITKLSEAKLEIAACKCLRVGKELAEIHYKHLQNEKFYNELERAFKEISENVYRGRNVKKKLIPKTLIQKYGLNNLWVYNLSSGWRLIYSAGNNEIEVLAIVLDWMSHKDYEKLFNF